MQFSLLHPPLRQFPFVLSMGTKTGGDGYLVSIGPVTPSHALHVATFNSRQLWLHDEAIHDGFPMLSRILLYANVGVCCIQKINAGDITTLLVDQPHTCDGPCGSRLGSSVLDLRRCCLDANSWSSRISVNEVANFWRVCVCLLMQPHLGIDVNVRVAFLQELIPSLTFLSLHVVHV